MEKDTEAALLWIVGLLREHNIPFRVAGGFAARVYGVNRELADIDIDVPDEAIQTLYPLVKEYVIEGPEQYRDETWDLYLMTLSYKGQEIDLAGNTTLKFFDREAGVWRLCSGDLTNYVEREAWGLTLPIIPKKELIAYKTKAGREVDIEDVRQLSRL